MFSTRWPRWGVIAATFAVALSWGEVADAQKKARPNESDPKEHAERGQRLYELRRYGDSVKEFERAYELSGDPSYLYNIAQGHRLAGHSQEAINAYELYLARVPRAPNRADIEKRIAELKAMGRPPNTLEQAPAPTAAPAQAAPAPVAPQAAPNAAAPAPSSPGAPAPAPAASSPGAPAPPPPGSAPPGTPYAQPYAYQPYPAYGPQPPPAQVGIDPVAALAMTPPGHHTHDGFFLRFLLGGAYHNAAFQGESLSGTSVLLAFALGWAMTERLVVYGEIYESSVSNPEVKGFGQTRDEPGTASDFGLGAGLAYYLMPWNAYASLTLGVEQYEQQDANETVVRTSKWGPGATVSLGKEFWVSTNWGLGIALQGHYGAVPRGGAGSIGVKWFGIAFSATYN